VFLKSGNKIEVEAAANCSAIPLYCPYFAGTDFFKKLLPISK
jgi:hypothetical protein